MPDSGYPAPADSLLLELASQDATGCLTLNDGEGEQSSVWFRDGQVYAVSVPGRRPLLGVRLMSSGALTPEALAEALEVQRTELQGWRLGELLVHLGFVDRSVVESFVTEQLRDQVADLLHWTVVEGRFRNGKRTRQDVAPPVEVADLIAMARDRDARWAEVVPFIGGPDAVPVLSTSATPASDVVLGPYDWALLCKVDGQRTISDLADDCGFTVYEAGMVVVGLLDAGLVDIERTIVEVESVPADEWAAAPSDAELATSVARVAEALKDMGYGHADERRKRWEVTPTTAPEPAPAPRPARSPFTPSPAREDSNLADVVSLDAERESREREEQDRLEREATERAEAERLEAEAAEAEAERLEAARIAAEQAEAERAEAERIEAERVEAEQAEAERLEAERLEAERVEAERVAAELAEAERIEAERLEAERLEAERVEAERVAAELAEAERIEAERLEAERVAAEKAEAERLEAERLAAEQAEAERLEAERLEAERIAAEQAEAERLEAERLEAERIAAEQAEAERLEAERVEAERIAAELAEAERLEAERLEAERVEAERLEAERIAAEQAEAERLEAERLEAERLAAEQAQAERLEAERAEAERVEAERLAAEQAVAERLEAERLEAERADAERVEAERLEAARLERAAAEAAATAALEAERRESERHAEELLEQRRITREQLEREQAALLAASLEIPVPTFDGDPHPASIFAIDTDDDSAATGPTYELDMGELDSDALATLSAPTDDVPSPTIEPEVDAPAAVDEPAAPTAEPDAEPQPEREPEPAMAGARAEGADMAALLFELSSLGGAFDNDTQEGSAKVVSRPLQADPNDHKGKKRRGLFGR